MFDTTVYSAYGQEYMYPHDTDFKMTMRTHILESHYELPYCGIIIISVRKEWMKLKKCILAFK